MNETTLPMTTTPPELPPPVQPRSARWPWVLLGLLLAALLAIGLVAEALDSARGFTPITVTIDDERVVDGWNLANLPPAHKVVLASVIVLSMLAALVAVPVALLLGLLAVLAMVLALVGLPVIMLVLLLGLALSPLLLLGWLVWRLLQ
jgi:hypothetical protein